MKKNSESEGIFYDKIEKKRSINGKKVVAYRHEIASLPNGKPIKVNLYGEKIKLR